MQRSSLLFLFLIFVLPFAAAQIQTVPNALGETVIENITLDPNGNPTTQTLLTLPAAVTQTVTTTDVAGDTLIEVILGDGAGDSVTQTVQTIPAQGQGPVGQPGPTGAAGLPTPFQYTTTDAAGATHVVQATFTPSFPATTPPVQTFQATVLDYSQYSASYVTGAQAVVDSQNGALPQSTGWWGLSAVISILGGFFLLV